MKKQILLILLISIATINIYAADIIGPLQVCSGTPVIYYAQPGSGESNYQFSVSGGTITSYGTTSQGYSSITVNWSSSGTGTVYLTYYTFAYPSFKNLSVQINPAAVTPAITGLFDLCQESLNGQVYNTDISKYNYNWTISPSSAGTITSGQGSSRVTINWYTAGNLSVSFQSSLCSVTTSLSKSISIYSKATPIISGQTTYCYPASNFIYTTEAGKSNYQWTIQGGTKVSGGGSSDNTITINWNATTIQNIIFVAVKYNDPSNGGCLSNVGQLSVSAQNLSVSISGPTSVRAPFTTTYTATSLGTTTSEGWNWNSGSLPQNNITSGTSNSVLTTTFNSAGGPYTISVSRTWNGCTSLPASITVNATSSPCCGGKILPEALMAANEASNIEIYDVWPNPASEYIAFSIPSYLPNGAKISLVDINAKSFYNGIKENDETVIKINSSSFPEGLYLLKIAAQKEVLVKKLFIKH